MPVRSRHLRRLVAAAGLGLVFAGTSVYAATNAPGGADAPAVALSASGAMSVTDSLGGGAILSTSVMAPGSSTSGTVTVTNSGGSPGELTLSAGDGTAVGARGRRLLDALELRVIDLTDGTPSLVYQGRFDRIGPHSLAVLAPSAGRTFRFIATLPDGGSATAGAGDNLLQEATAAGAYDWTLSEPQPGHPAAAPQALGAPAPTPTPVAPAATPNAPLRTVVIDSPCRRRVLGSSRADLLVGSALGDRIYGRGGADRLNGRAGRDCLSGGAGNDRLSGGAAADHLEGGPGNDELTGDAGRDRLLGGSGNDRVHARDGERDVIDCGPGRDAVVIDRIDVVRRCEVVHRTRPPR